MEDRLGSSVSAAIVVVVVGQSRRRRHCCQLAQSGLTHQTKASKNNLEGKQEQPGRLSPNGYGCSSVLGQSGEVQSLLNRVCRGCSGGCSEGVPECSEVFRHL